MGEAFLRREFIGGRRPAPRHAQLLKVGRKEDKAYQSQPKLPFSDIYIKKKSIKSERVLRLCTMASFVLVLFMV